MANESNVWFSNQLLSKEEVVAKIEQGEYLVLAADESVLSSLPAGNWIAGTIPYFMADEGGIVTRDKIFVNTINGVLTNNPPRVMLYDENTISRIAQDAPEHGFTITILPATSDVHINFAQNAPNFPNMYFSPIIGWISGVHLDDLGEKTPKTGFGPAGGMLMDSHAVAIHVPLSNEQTAEVNTINLFEQGKGAEIKFNKTGFNVSDCVINGEQTNLATYIKDANIDTRLPLVADYSGIKVNVSIQAVNESDNSVDLYAPVFSDVSYYFAEPVKDYITEFDKAVTKDVTDHISFSCNCILNFLYSELEGKSTKDITGPITFGEVAYQLLNQTLVYMTLKANN
ncbi:DUF6976 family protein [Teredinibacter sp. KSP-S5-2]|uniref:DUF6976 family protein n=1 Tax=Teredinibacter sp. KSP-S5-2 TaxID=3034506 RepID=UPI0029348E7B|nr:hypothetical protein [Teredinibacter sp. KSP-S5-2]WNO09420.1 hypothetical protein P5V12_20985 [Teredinibacter sp. KSP-S5-2]